MPIIAFDVYLAVGSMVAVKVGWVEPINQDADQALEAISNTIQKIELLLRLQLAKKLSLESALRVIASLKESKVDYLLLLYLQLPDSIRKKSELISSLECLCNQLKVDFTHRHFYECIWSIFERAGVSPVTPDKFVTANRKEEVLKEYERVKKSWGKHSPLFLQTYNTKDGCFTNHLYRIFRTGLDGVLWLLDILKEGEFVFNGRVYTVCGAFEHVISLSTLTCQLYDCEIMSTVFDEQKTTEEIKEMVLCFPQCITSLMISEDLLDIESFISFTVKNRTRRVADDKVKISYHFVPNICATKGDHNQAVVKCFGKYKGRIDEAVASIKSTGFLPKDFLTNGINDSLLAWDTKAINNGITTPFSRKKRSDPFPSHIYTEEVCGGVAICRDGCLKEPQDLESANLSDKERLMLIYIQLYTTPKKEMICYNEAAFEGQEVLFYFFIFYFLFFCSHWDSNPFTPWESIDCVSSLVRAENWGGTKAYPAPPAGCRRRCPPPAGMALISTEGGDWQGGGGCQMQPPLP